MILEFTFHFDFNNHCVVSALISLWFYLAAPTQRIAIFFTCNMLVKRHSDFIALGLLTVVGVMGDMGLLPVNTSGEETIAA